MLNNTVKHLKAESCSLVIELTMTKDKEWNPDVPIETLYRWKSKECEKLRKRVADLEATVSALRNNIRIIIDDPEAKQAIRMDARIKAMTKERNALDKKLHIAYNDREELIRKLVQYQNPK